MVHHYEDRDPWDELNCAQRLIRNYELERKDLIRRLEEAMKRNRSLRFRLDAALDKLQGL